MCCVVGYIGSGCGVSSVLAGMTRLEYRGYDSAGFGHMDAAGAITVRKAVGDVAALVATLDRSPVSYGPGVTIGHTRWSTHGVVSVENAHPVFDCAQRCAVVHNGIIENEAALRVGLKQRGHLLHSATDSELIAHLLEESVESCGERDPHAVLARVVEQLVGAYAFVATMSAFPGMLLLARQRSPLCVIHTSEGILVASDPVAASPGDYIVGYIPEGVCGVVSQDAVAMRTFTGAHYALAYEPLAIAPQLSEQRLYPHVMLQEMYEQREVVERLVHHLMRVDLSWLGDLAHASRIVVIGSGTSYHAALLLAQLFEERAGIPAVAIPASEARDVPYLDAAMPWVFALSQSGETADTLESMRFYQRKGAPIVALTNVAVSTMAREATCVVPLHAGTECAVASTKTFVAHIAAGYILADRLKQMRALTVTSGPGAVEVLRRAAVHILHNMDAARDIIDRSIAPRIAHHRRALFMGRRSGYVMAAEAALKLKELAYCFAEAYYGGELKHGPLALIEPEIPVVVCSSREPALYRRLVANVQEVKSRRGHIIAIAFPEQAELLALADDAIVLQSSDDAHVAPIAMAGVLQYIAYQVAVLRGCSIDRPRNLAKSVTVE